MIQWCAFYTKGTKYEQEAENLVNQFVRWNILVEKIPLEDKHNWMQTIYGRAIRLDELMEQQCSNPDKPVHDDDWIGLLDTDLLVRSDPVLLKAAPPKGYDVMVTDAGNSAAIGRRFSAGIVAFAPTKEGRKALREWAKYCKEDPLRGQKMNLLEQCYLEWALLERSVAKRFIVPLDKYNTIPYGTSWQTSICLHTRDPQVLKDAAPCESLLPPLPGPRLYVPTLPEDLVPAKPEDLVVPEAGDPKTWAQTVGTAVYPEGYVEPEPEPEAKATPVVVREAGRTYFDGVEQKPKKGKKGK